MLLHVGVLDRRDRWDKADCRWSVPLPLSFSKLATYNCSRYNWRRRTLFLRGLEHVRCGLWVGDPFPFALYTFDGSHTVWVLDFNFDLARLWALNPRRGWFWLFFIAGAAYLFYT